MRLELSGNELSFLLSLYPPTLIVGVPSPHAENRLDSFRSGIDEGHVGLVIRGLVQDVSASEIRLEERLAAIVEVIVHPSASVLVASGLGARKPSVRSFYLKGGRAVELSEQSLDEYVIGDVEVRTTLVGLVSVMVQLPRSGNGTPRGMFQVNAPDFERARALAEQGEKKRAFRVLEEAGVSKERVRAIVPALTAPDSRVSVVAFWNRDRPELTSVKGFSLLAANGNTWELGLVREKVVRIKPLTKASLARRLGTIMPPGVVAP